MTLKYQISNIKYQINKIKKVLDYWVIGLLGYSPPSGAGQVVLMLVLITIVGLTIALSLISRTVTDIRISSQIEQSGRAFSAAEAGVESALKGAAVGSPGTVSLSNASASYEVTQLGGNTNNLVFPVSSPGIAQTVWLVDHNADGSLNENGNSYSASSSFDVCWSTDPNSTPAITLNLFYKSGISYKVVRASFDTDAVSRGNNFSSADSAGNYCDSNYRFRKTINPESDFGINPATSKLLFLQLQSVYEKSTIALKPSASLPNQGKIINSVGQTDTGVIRKIQVIQGYNVLPPFMNFGLFVEN